MIASRILTIATVSLAVLAAIGCSSPQTNQTATATPAPVYVATTPPPSEPVVMAVVVPPPPAATVVAVNNDPVVYTSPTIVTERAPRADRN